MCLTSKEPVLSEKQIETVINWLNTWHSLKFTATPKRFYEDFTKHLNESKINSVPDQNNESPKSN